MNFRISCRDSIWFILASVFVHWQLFVFAAKLWLSKLPSRFNFNRSWSIWISQVALEKYFSKKIFFLIHHKKCKIWKRYFNNCGCFLTIVWDTLLFYLWNLINVAMHLVDLEETCWSYRTPSVQVYFPVYSENSCN